MTQSTIPVTVIGGYLGSGKTTLVNHLIRNANGKRLAIMVNEFGELPIDEDLIEAEGDELISLAGGCVCCSFGSDLVEAMNTLSQLNPRPDNVVIEASGVALPGSIASTLSLLPNFAIDGVIVLADAETVQQRAQDKYMADTILRQLSDADIVLLNKTDLVPSTLLAQTANWLATTAENAQVIHTHNSVISPSIVLHDFTSEHDKAIESHVNHALHFETRSLPATEPVDVLAFAERLFQDYPTLVRAKGFLKDRDGHLKTLQVVGKRITIADAPNTVKTGIVVIF
ncbi:MAG: CobW family GTP-binding protein [Leucothrix sp.]